MQNKHADSFTLRFFYHCTPILHFLDLFYINSISKKVTTRDTRKFDGENKIWLEFQPNVGPREPGGPGGQVDHIVTRLYRLL